jgi:hypothetical protein
MKKIFNPILKHFGYQLAKKSKKYKRYKEVTPLLEEKQAKPKVKEPVYEEGPVFTAQYTGNGWVLLEEGETLRFPPKTESPEIDLHYIDSDIPSDGKWGGVVYVSNQKYD